MWAAFRVRRCWLSLAWCFRRPDGNSLGDAGCLVRLQPLKSKCGLFSASDGAGLALLGVFVDPTAIAWGMRDTRQGRSQVNGRACEW